MPGTITPCQIICKWSSVFPTIGTLSKNFKRTSAELEQPNRYNYSYWSCQRLFGKTWIPHSNDGKKEFERIYCDSVFMMNF